MQQAAYVWVEDLEQKIVDTLEHNERWKITSPYTQDLHACTCSTCTLCVQYISL